MMNGGVSPFLRPSVAPLAGRTVMQVIPALEAGAAEQTTIDIASALVDAGARALVACTGGRLVSELQAKGGLWVPFPANTRNPIAMARNVGKLRAILREEAVDLVHARARAPGWVALGAARRGGIPFVTTFQGSYSGPSTLKLRYNSVMARGDIVIADSRNTAALVARLYPFAAERTAIIRRGADLRVFSPAAVDTRRVRKLRREWGVAADERIVLMAARLTSWKGQRVLIDAAKLLRQRETTGIRFILAGDPRGVAAYVGELDALVTAAGLDGIVRRVGHCADMPAALMASSVVVVPPTEPHAFGRSAVEAQAMGIPVVVSDLGAVAETVLAPPDVSPAGRTGWRVKAGDAEALADAIELALNLGAAARDTMAMRARAHVEAAFSLDRMQQATLAAYLSLLQPKTVPNLPAARSGAAG